MIYKYPLIALALGAITTGGLFVWNFFNGNSSTSLDSQAPVFKFENSEKLEIPSTPQALAQTGPAVFGLKLPDKSKFPLTAPFYLDLWQEYRSKNIDDENAKKKDKQDYLNSVSSYLTNVVKEISALSISKMAVKDQDLEELLLFQKDLTDFYINYSRSIFNSGK